jgi:hypothetical protein
MMLNITVKVCSNFEGPPFPESAVVSIDKSVIQAIKRSLRFMADVKEVCSVEICEIGVSFYDFRGDLIDKGATFYEHQLDSLIVESGSVLVMLKSTFIDPYRSDKEVFGFLSLLELGL